jgi:hypothetical protein
MTDNPDHVETIAHLRRCLNLLAKESGELVQEMRCVKTNVEIWEQANAIFTAVTEANISIAIACDDGEGEDD